ncbi:MAG: KUP/HAK/KT family potassium transporter [Verrucomicrobia bacterium]|nr:KUP/HAK/KT family potassium transporter [Verrucomicrobiota bacterium]
MSQTTPEPVQGSNSTPVKPLTMAAAIAALGVVFGDIGTSPLYAFRECLRNGLNNGGTIGQIVVPAVSMIIWSLICVVMVKYVLFIMEANEDGEGGIMTLVSLATKKEKADDKMEEERTHVQAKRKHRSVLVLLGVFGTALLFGDGVITPAISVLSALEGIKDANTSLKGPFSEQTLIVLIPAIAVIILVGIFALQRRGSGKVGSYFGPITLVWFACIATTGIGALVQHPAQAYAILHAFNPLESIGFFIEHPGLAMIITSAVFLSVTGAEALYADMGHFGQKPIRAGWCFIVFPALILNYLGQGAWALAQPVATFAVTNGVDGKSQFVQEINPFFNLAPNWAQIPLVIIATLAAIIASQALIAGAFSTTMQAIQLNFLPRMRIEQTSDEESGQIYIPIINWLLMIGSITLVLQYKSSQHLASAYGIAVSLTMLVTTILFGQYLRQRFKIPTVTAYVFVAPVILLEVVFVASNLPKILESGWLPLTAGFLVYYIMAVWNKGRQVMKEKMSEGETSGDFENFLDSVEDRFIAGKLSRVKGTAVYMTGSTKSVPMALAHNLKHNKSLHDHIIVVSLKVDDERAIVPPADRISFNTRGPKFCKVESHEEFPSVLSVTGKFGFREKQDVFPVLEAAYKELGITPNSMETTYFLSRETIVRATTGFSLNAVQEKLFEVLNRNALSATAYFNLPPGRVVELGMQVEL